MNEQASRTSGSGINRPLAVRWGIASFLVNLVVCALGAFLLGEHEMSGGEMLGFSVAIGVVNGVTCGHVFDGLHARLRAGHWLMVGVIALFGGWLSTFLDPAFMGVSSAFASGVTLVGMPMGYLIAQMWASRPVAPHGHPDNIPD